MPEKKGQKSSLHFATWELWKTILSCMCLKLGTNQCNLCKWHWLISEVETKCSGPVQIRPLCIYTWPTWWGSCACFYIALPLYNQWFCMCRSVHVSIMWLKKKYLSMVKKLSEGWSLCLKDIVFPLCIYCHESKIYNISDICPSDIYLGKKSVFCFQFIDLITFKNKIKSNVISKTALYFWVRRGC